MSRKGIREPRIHWWEARMIAMLIRDRTIPATTEYGFCHFSAKRIDSCLSRFLASLPSSPSEETTKGVKDRRWLKQGCKYFDFFDFSYDSNTYSAIRLR